VRLLRAGTEHAKVDGGPVERGLNRLVGRCKGGRWSDREEGNLGVEDERRGEKRKERKQEGSKRKNGCDKFLVYQESTKGVDSFRQQDGGHGSRNPLRSV